MRLHFRENPNCDILTGMIIYFGADHRGFSLKEFLKSQAQDQGYETLDCGNSQYDESDDYPDFARAVAEKVGKNPDGSRGILICGSGVGMDIAANKFPGVRAGLALSSDQIYDARRDDDINILAVPADFVSQEDAGKILKIFLETKFKSEERHRRRLGKIAEIEDSL